MNLYNVDNLDGRVYVNIKVNFEENVWCSSLLMIQVGLLLLPQISLKKRKGLK
jgi:hypothetical protein